MWMLISQRNLCLLILVYLFRLCIPVNANVPNRDVLSKYIEWMSKENYMICWKAIVKQHLPVRMAYTPIYIVAMAVCEVCVCAHVRRFHDSSVCEMYRWEWSPIFVFMFDLWSSLEISVHCSLNVCKMKKLKEMLYFHCLSMYVIRIPGNTYFTGNSRNKPTCS